MNILHILGNGFDINLGLRTSYSNFYEWYSKLDNKDPRIIELKKNIADNSYNWSDLEIALGKYTATKNLSKDDFNFIYDNLLEELCDYLEQEFEIFKNTYYDLENFHLDLASPERFLETRDRNTLLEFKNKLNTMKGEVSTITLNYTRTIDVFYEKQNLFELKTTTNQLNFNYKKVLHLHGYTDLNVILGVNDISQIENIEFRKDLSFCKPYIKSESNSLARHNIDLDCYNIIQKSNLFCLFGCSLGLTDKYIWEKIGNRISEGAKVIIFKTSRGIKKRNIRIQNDIRDSIVSNFLKLASSKDNNVEEFTDNVFVSFGANIFNYKKAD